MHAKTFYMSVKRDNKDKIAIRRERTPNREWTCGYEYDEDGRPTKVLCDGMLSEMYPHDNEGRRWSETNAFRRLYDRRMRYGPQGIGGNRLLACGHAATCTASLASAKCARA